MASHCLYSSLQRFLSVDSVGGNFDSYHKLISGQFVGHIQAALEEWHASGCLSSPISLPIQGSSITGKLQATLYKCIDAESHRLHPLTCSVLRSLQKVFPAPQFY